ncbi:hypothetical protein CSC2_42240 [Clostridium zeae]|uniref:Uncharacterized protein n=1 Tax=Clostridium zeae TaxID=2759022 RepID=A0ABQ1EFU1_9CLOT|nr:hypothetical protein CSC2_42240 [Clostridium zeae]
MLAKPSDFKSLEQLFRVNSKKIKFMSPSKFSSHVFGKVDALKNSLKKVASVTFLFLPIYRYAKYIYYVNEL